MPSIIDKIKLPRNLDRRIKLSEQDKFEILNLIKYTDLSNAEIGTIYWVHRKTIYLMRNPKQKEKEREQYRIRRLDWRYYNKDKHREAIQNTRKYKHLIFKK